MEKIEMTSTIVLITIAILIVAADIVVRLVLQPARKEKFLHELLDQLVEPSVYAEEPLPSAVSAVPAADLNESLLRLFEKSGTSREILGALADGKGLSQKDLSIVLNQELARRGKPALPFTVARRVAGNLLHAGVLVVEHRHLRVTELGQNLNLLLQRRKGAGPVNAT